LPDFKKLSLNTQNVELSQGAILANDSYIFIRRSENGTFDNPQIGDLRISYYVLPSNFEGTLFGKLNGNKIDPYFDKNGNRLYRLFYGTRDEAIATFRSEYTTSLWILRFIGFLMMWVGVILLFEPISVVMDILPIFGALSRSLIGIITFLVALILSIVTIIVSGIIHNIIALIISIGIVIAIIIFYFIKIKKKRLATQINFTFPQNPSQSS